MIGKLHIPTEEYGFVEVEVEGDSIESLVSKYPLDKDDLFLDKIIEIVDSNLEDGWGSPDDYAYSTSKQKEALQALKRFKKRK